MRLEMIVGPMKSGKTDELIRRLKLLQIANCNILIFRSAKDTRDVFGKLVSRSGLCLDNAIMENDPDKIFTICQEHFQNDMRKSVVAFEEIQFYDLKITSVINVLRFKMDCKVICCGLDMDYKGIPFKVTSELLGMSDKVSKMKAVCKKCFTDAARTYKMTTDTKRIVIGDEIYEPLCNKCWRDKNENIQGMDRESK